MPEVTHQLRAVPKETHYIGRLALWPSENVEFSFFGTFVQYNVEKKHLGTKNATVARHFRVFGSQA